MKKNNNTETYWLKKNSYYYKKLAQYYQFIIPPDSRVLQVECRSGFFLASTNPAYGLGINTDAAHIQEAKTLYSDQPNLEFKTLSAYELAQKNPDLKFDYIIIAHHLMHEYDIQNFLESLQTFCTPKTRIVINICSWIWEPLVRLGQHLWLARNAPFKNWIALADLENFLTLAGYESISQTYRTLIPINIPLISPLFNKCISNIPLIERLCLDQCIVARSSIVKQNIAQKRCSIIVPCKNEAGNIRHIVERIPQLGSHTEVIFVEGHSYDKTLTEIKQVCTTINKSNFTYKYHVQPGKGKWDAVKIGFATATGDVLVILDADMTVPPEELPKFWNALVQNKGEFINGVRLVYAMENNAMQSLNLIANKLFSLGFSWLLQQRLKDTLCGTKLLLVEDWKAIEKSNFLKNQDPFGDFELIFGAVKQNLKLIDVPVHYKDRSYGTTQISRFKHGAMLIKMTLLGFLKFKINNR